MEEGAPVNDSGAQNSTTPRLLGGE
jgi:hypothetical protein